MNVVGACDDAERGRRTRIALGAGWACRTGRTRGTLRSSFAVATTLAAAEARLIRCAVPSWVDPEPFGNDVQDSASVAVRKPS